MQKLLYNRRAGAVLSGMAAGGRFPHALLLEGPAGCGKKTAAALIAQERLCTGAPRPCGVCSGCIKVEKGVHPDVRFYTVPEGKKEFPVELARDIRQDAYIAPNEGACKVYIVDQAHTMNASAQNALLKIIEEPPAGVYFILLCENRAQMLPTILSRVVSVELETPSPDECAAAPPSLEPNVPGEQRRAAAAGAAGNIGQARTLLKTAKPSKAAADARLLREALVFGDRYTALRILAAYDKDRAALGQTLALLREGFAQVALGRETDARFSNRVSPGQAVAAAQIVQTARLRAERNIGVPLLCACMVEQIKSTLG